MHIVVMEAITLILKCQRQCHKVLLMGLILRHIRRRYLVLVVVQIRLMPVYVQVAYLSLFEEVIF